MRTNAPWLFLLLFLVLTTSCVSPPDHETPRSYVPLTVTANGTSVDTQPKSQPINRDKKEAARWKVTSTAPADIESVKIEFEHHNIATVTCTPSGRTADCTSGLFGKSSAPDKHEKYSVTVKLSGQNAVTEDPDMVIYP